MCEYIYIYIYKAKTKKFHQEMSHSILAKLLHFSLKVKEI